VPKVETAARALLLELNEPLYRTAVGDSSGQFPALGTLLSALLACDFDPDRERFLRTFLLTDGSNVRNYIAHGFTDTIDRTTAVLALRAGVVLALLTSNDATPRDTATLKLVLSPLLGHRRAAPRGRGSPPPCGQRGTNCGGDRQAQPHDERPALSLRSLGCGCWRGVSASGE
jgi:hypothetical protein